MTRADEVWHLLGLDRFCPPICDLVDLMWFWILVIAFLVFIKIEMNQES